MTFKINRRTGKNEGLSFIKDGYTFKASDVSRQFSYSKLDKQLSWDMPKTQTEIESKQQPIRQEEERNNSVTDNLIESNGMAYLHHWTLCMRMNKYLLGRRKRRIRKKRIEE